jgi:surface-anchored protein
MNAVARSARSLAPLAVAVSLAFAAAAARAATILSSGHTDVFEAEYEAGVLHLGVHNDDGHFEPGDVILQVKNAAYRSTVGLQGDIQTFLGPNAWVLPADQDEALALGVLRAGAAKAEFPDQNTVTFTMIAAGAENPGKFILFSGGSTNFVRLSADGDTVLTNSFGLGALDHVHYNWGFSAPGTYTFDMQASYGSLSSPVETYTFQVVPEPSTWVLAGTAALGAIGLRRRFGRAVA